MARAVLGSLTQWPFRGGACRVTQNPESPPRPTSPKFEGVSCFLACLSVRDAGDVRGLAHLRLFPMT